MTGFIIFVVLMIIFGFGRNAAKKQQKSGQPSPRVQALMAKIQAQQAANQPPIQGQYTQPASGQPLPAQYGAPAPQYAPPPPGQYQPAPGQWAAPAQQLSPQEYLQQMAPGEIVLTTQPGGFQDPRIIGQVHTPGETRTYYQQPHQQATVPAPGSALERRVRELMKSGNEVPAIRLLCDEQDLGIIEAQKYARSLIAPAGKPGQAASDGRSERGEDENRYVGSAAFAESVFDLDRDENVWASGWVEKPEPEDRTDMDELWQTVRNAGRPATPPS